MLFPIYNVYLIRVLSATTWLWCPELNFVKWRPDERENIKSWNSLISHTKIRDKYSRNFLGPHEPKRAPTAAGSDGGDPGMEVG